MIIVGIDPGVSGALTIIDVYVSPRSAQVFPFAKKSYEELFEIFDWLRVLRGFGLDVRVLIEKVWGFPGDTPMTAFNFGMNFGMLLGFLVALGFKIDDIPPRKWQRIIGIFYPPNTKTNDKERMHKKRALELYPNIETTQKAAASVLIAETNRRQLLRKGEL